MGDSDIASHMSLLALLVIASAVVAFAVALRIPRRPVRIIIGILLLAVGAGCGILSLPASLIVAVLGFASIVLAIVAKDRS